MLISTCTWLGLLCFHILHFTPESCWFCHLMRKTTYFQLNKWNSGFCFVSSGGSFSRAWVSRTFIYFFANPLVWHSVAKWIPQARGPSTHCCPLSCIRCVFATAPLSRDECQVWQIAPLSTLSSLIGPPSRSTAMCVTGVNGWKLLTPAKLWCGALDQQAKMYRFWDVRANLSHRRTKWSVSQFFSESLCN